MLCASPWREAISQAQFLVAGPDVAIIRFEEPSLDLFGDRATGHDPREPTFAKDLDGFRRLLAAGRVLCAFAEDPGLPPEQVEVIGQLRFFLRELLDAICELDVGPH